jgi:copper oxidase (laccase) domain-containing protein
VQSLTLDGNSLGLWTYQGDALIVFGNRHLGQAALSQFFPFLDFRILNQVHGTHVVEQGAEHGAGSTVLPVADGHWTTQKNMALVIKSADCLPILALGHGVLALHSGWRGTAANIVREGCQNFSAREWWIGPHIQKESFQVGPEVAEKFRPWGRDTLLPDPQDGKLRVDLKRVAERQIHACEPRATVQVTSIDTRTDPDWASYRRSVSVNDPLAGERNFSFIARVDRESLQTGPLAKTMKL